MQLKFSGPSGTTLDVLAVNGQSINFQGANRDSLEIQIAKSAITFDALDKLTATQTNMAHLTLIDGDKQYVHDNYSLRASLALKPVVTTPATSTAPAVTEDRLCVTLAQKAYQEQQVEQLQGSVDALTLSALGAK
jgi:predicted negative regulator of RcsB-dependent stress response